MLLRACPCLPCNALSRECLDTGARNAVEGSACSLAKFVHVPGRRRKWKGGPAHPSPPLGEREGCRNRCRSHHGGPPAIEACGANGAPE
eukprot:6491919-Amphidinium_carterae.1